MILTIIQLPLLWVLSAIEERSSFMRIVSTEHHIAYASYPEYFSRDDSLGNDKVP